MKFWLIILILVLVFGASTVLKALGAVVLLVLMAPVLLVLVLVLILLVGD